MTAPQAVTPSARWEPASAIPLVVGVSGHRDPHPDGLVRMREGLLRTLDLLAGELPNTPLLVLSGLAAGADQLAVQWSSEWARSRPLPSGGARIRCIGVLPFPLEEYRRDFPPGRETEELESALARCAYSFALPEPGPDGALRAFDVPDVRDQGYRDLGLFVARQSDIVVAFWDGKATLKRGGTADVVNFCSAGGLQAIDRILWDCPSSPFQATRPLLVPEERVPVVHVETPRRGDGSVPPSVGEGLRCEGAWRPAETGIVSAEFRERDRINAEVARVLGPSASVSGMPATSCLDGDPRWAHFVGRFRALDHAASELRAGLARREAIVVLLIGLAIVCFQVFSAFLDGVSEGPEPRDDWARVALVGGYLGLIASGFVLKRRESRRKTHFVRASLRALAEAMRVQGAIVRAGVLNEQVGNWLSARTCEGTEPLRALLRPCVLEALSIARDSHARTLLAEGGRGLSEVRREWIDGPDGQLAYFRRNLRPDSRRSKKLARAATLKLLSYLLVFVLAAFMLGLTIMMLWTDHEVLKQLPFGDQWFDIGTCLVGVSLALCAVVEMSESSEETSSDLREFRRMGRIYGIALRRLDSAGKPQERLEVIRALGKEALAELAEWYVRYRERAVETRLG